MVLELESPKSQVKNLPDVYVQDLEKGESFKGYILKSEQNGPIIIIIISVKLKYNHNFLSFFYIPTTI